MPGNQRAEVGEGVHGGVVEIGPGPPMRGKMTYLSESSVLIQKKRGKRAENRNEEGKKVHFWGVENVVSSSVNRKNRCSKGCK